MAEYYREAAVSTIIYDDLTTAQPIVSCLCFASSAWSRSYREYSICIHVFWSVQQNSSIKGGELQPAIIETQASEGLCLHSNERIHSDGQSS